MQENETRQAPIEAITGTLKSQGIPCECLPATVTHPIEHFRLRCLDLASIESGFVQKPEDIIKTATLYADFVLGASGGTAPKTLPYTVGKHGASFQFSGDPSAFEATTISQAEQRLHILQKLFDDIDPNPDSMCILEAIHHKMTLHLLNISRNYKEAQEVVAAVQEEIDNLVLDIIQHGNTDFLLKERKPFSACTPIPGPIRLSKRQRLWAKKAEEVAVS